MTHRRAPRQAVPHALVMGAAAAAGYSLPALTQETGGSTSPTLEDVVVTGTRIARQDYEEQRPAVTVSSETFKLAGASQIETVLNTMPQLVPSISISSNNPSNGGQANVNLRGLGTNRTLVLLDGSRLTPSSVSGVVDLNTIPTPLIESIEILSGGASSTYGSDAVAGVVNIKLKRNYTGVQFDAGTGWTSENDGKTNIFSVMAGTDIGQGRGNIAVAFGHDKRDTVLYSQRSFSSIQLNQNLAPLGNTTIPEGRVDWDNTNLPTQAAWDSVFGKYGVPAGAIVAASNPAIGFNRDRTTFTIAPVRNFRGDTTVPGFSPASYGYNAFLPNYLVLPLTRRQASLFGHYEIVPDKVELYGRAMYTKYHADQALAPTPVTGPTEANATFNIPYCVTGTTNCFVGSPATNPILLNSPDLLALANSRATPTAPLIFVRRVIEAGNRIQVNEYEVKQGLLGFRGDFGNGWKWDIFGSYGENDNVFDQYGNLSRSAIVKAVGNPSGGLTGCTSFDPLGLNSINTGCVAAMSVVAKSFVYLKQITAIGSLSGDLFNLPAGPVLFAAGVEYRENEADFQPDQVLATGDVVGFNAQKPVQGRIEVTEPFIELSVPLLSEKSMVKYLGLDLGYRHSDYNLSGGVETYKVALQWNPSESLKIRGSYNRSVRAPNISELYLPVQENFPAYADPCRVTSPERAASNPDKAKVEALCIVQGIPAAVLASFTQRNTQARSYIGGNTKLEPEVADTYGFGVTWQFASESEWASQLSASVDYFNFKIEKAIDSLSGSSIVGGCFNQLNRNPSYSNSNPFCQLYRRDASSAVTDIVATSLNLGGTRGQGVDLQVDYGLPLTALGAGEKAGSLTFNLVATHVLRQESRDTVIEPYVRGDGIITSSTASALPQWKANLATTYRVGDLSFRWTLRYFDGMDVRNPDAALTPSTGIRPYTASFVYHDLSLRWSATDACYVSLTVNNLSNMPPALYTTSTQAGIQANTDPSTYDILGRRHFLNFGYKF